MVFGGWFFLKENSKKLLFFLHLGSIKYKFTQWFFFWCLLKIFCNFEVWYWDFDPYNINFLINIFEIFIYEIWSNIWGCFLLTLYTMAMKMTRHRVNLLKILWHFFNKYLRIRSLIKRTWFSKLNKDNNIIYFFNFLLYLLNC